MEMLEGMNNIQGCVDAKSVSEIEELKRQTGYSADKTDAHRKQAAKKFEGIFIKEILKKMNKPLDEEGLFESSGMRQMKGLFWDFLSEEAADSGGFGLWKDIYIDMCEKANVEPKLDQQV